MNYPDMREMARLATETYAHLQSLEQINPREMKYPAHGTPNWWALRLRYDELLSARLRRERADSPLRINEPEALAAKWAALGNEAADREYQRFVR